MNKPSDRAIAQAFWEKADFSMLNIVEIRARAREIDAAAPEGAQPVAWACTDYDGHVGVGLTQDEAKRNAGEHCNAFFGLYTATDYDKLREEVERLQMLCYEISRDCNACANERNEQRARAEAAEAREAKNAYELSCARNFLTAFIKGSFGAHEYNTVKVAQEHLDAINIALNAQGENK